MYAIIETGGKQYRVEKGDTIKVEKLDVEPGKKVTFENVLFIGDKTATIGTPTIEGATVTGKVVSVGRNKKVIVYKYKPKKGFHKKNGHRQFFTEVLIEKINSKKSAAKDTATDSATEEKATEKKPAAKKSTAKKDTAEKKPAAKKTTAKKTTEKKAEETKTEE